MDFVFEECLVPVELGVAGEGAVVRMAAVEGQRVGDDILVRQLVVNVVGDVVTGIVVSAIDVLIRVRHR